MGAAQRLNRLRKIAHEKRAIPGERYALRPFTVSVMARTSGGQAWDGTGSDAIAYTTVVLKEKGGQNPRVKWITPKMYMVGYPQDVELEVRITPELVASFTDIDPLSPEVIWVVTGPGLGTNGARFSAEKINVGSQITWTIGLKRLSSNVS